MRTLRETALGPWWQRALLYWLSQTTVHVTENCGRFSGYHDDGYPMICNRRAGHLGPWHYDSMNGLVWRSGEEPLNPNELLSSLQRQAREFGGHLSMELVNSEGDVLWSCDQPDADVSLWLTPTTGAVQGTFVGHEPANTFDVNEWRRNRDAWTEMLVLEQRLVQHSNIAPDAMTFPGADGSSTFQGRPIIDGARPGLVFYIKEPST